MASMKQTKSENENRARNIESVIMAAAAKAARNVEMVSMAAAAGIIIIYNINEIWHGIMALASKEYFFFFSSFFFLLDRVGGVNKSKQRGIENNEKA
jgi:hypothetical protein